MVAFMFPSSFEFTGSRQDATRNAPSPGDLGRMRFWKSVSSLRSDPLRACAMF